MVNYVIRMFKPLAMKFFLICCCAIIFTSCNNNEGDRLKENSVNEALTISAREMKLSAKKYLIELQEKMNRPETVYKAEVWYPIAERAHNISNNFEKYIDILLDKKPTETVVQNLVDSAKVYKDSIKSLCPEISKEFGESLLVASKSIDSAMLTPFFISFVKTENNYADILRVMKTRIAFNENSITQFCRYQIPDGFHNYSFFGVILGQNSKHFKVGDKLEINAGVGAFSNQSKPSFFFNGKQMPTIDGQTKFYLKINGNPGKYSIPVNISYTDQNGSKQSMESNVEYYIDK